VKEHAVSEMILLKIIPPGETIHAGAGLDGLNQRKFLLFLYGIGEVICMDVPLASSFFNGYNYTPVYTNNSFTYREYFTLNKFSRAWFKMARIVTPWPLNIVTPWPLNWWCFLPPKLKNFKEANGDIITVWPHSTGSYHWNAAW
jgi:hypothetical protein